MRPNYRIDMSQLTPEQQSEARLMQAFTESPEMQASFTQVNLAEKLLPALLESEHRLPPEAAAEQALTYAREMHHAGERAMQRVYNDWKAARLTDPAPALEEDTDDSAPAVEAHESEPDSDPVGGVVQEETISRDTAVADTVERTGRGENVTALATELPRVDPAAASVVPGFGAVDTFADDHDAVAQQNNELDASRGG